MFLDFWTLAAIFDFCYDIPEAPEVFRNLPRPHGFVVLQYGPVASHGDPFHPPNCKFVCICVPSAKYLVLGTKCQVLGTWYQVPSTWYQVPSTKYLVLGTKY